MNRTYRPEKGSAPENSALKIKLLRAVQWPFLTGFWHLEQHISRVQKELQARRENMAAQTATKPEKEKVTKHE